MVPILRKLSRFGADCSGSIAIVFAASMLMMMLAIGLAIDGARAYNVSSRVSGALDAAALSAAKLLDDEDVTDGEIEDRARRFFAAHFERVPILGIDISTLAIEIDRGRGEVELSVDVALKATFAQLAGIDRFTFPRSAKVRYEQKFIELAMVVDITGSMCMPCDKMDGLKAAGRALVQLLFSPSTPYGYVRAALVPFGSSVNAGPVAGAVSNGMSSDGCVVERDGSHNADDHQASGGHALGTSSIAANPRYSCMPSPVLPLTADSATLESSISALTTGGATAGHIGLAWGWYTISERWDSLWTGPNRPRRRASNVVKAVLLMTDGEFNTSYIPGAGLNSLDPATANSSAEQTPRLCANMKAEGITIYTVAFQAPVAAETLLAGCATSSAHHFTASSNGALLAAFQTIAERLTALRVTG